MAADVGLLLRRAGFGPTGAELAAARRSGYPATLSALLEPPGPDIGATGAPLPDLGLDPFAGKREVNPDQRAAGQQVRERQTEQITHWWLDRMAVATHQAVEKLVFFWHGHWATSVEKVHSPQLMLAQQRKFRDARDFTALARQMITDAALVIWLDGQHNTKRSPNENLARELLELFMVGPGPYTEKDVKEIGRALTGWRIGLSAEQMHFDAPKHDPGVKTILGTSRAFTADGVVDLLLRQPACPRFLASRLWLRYGSSQRPIPDGLKEKMAAEFPTVTAMLRVLFEADAFHDSRGQLAKQPVEWLVGAMRQLGIRPAALPAKTLRRIVDGLGRLGQTPFAPPSVGGWPAGMAWLTTGAAQVRLSLADLLTAQVPPAARTPEELADLLGVDGWTDRTYGALREVRAPRKLVTLGLACPEYLVT